MNKSWEKTKQMLLTHSVQRPPFSVSLYSLADLQAITHYLLHTCVSLLFYPSPSWARWCSLIVQTKLTSRSIDTSNCGNYVPAHMLIFHCIFDVSVFRVSLHRLHGGLQMFACGGISHCFILVYVFVNNCGKANGGSRYFRHYKMYQYACMPTFILNIETLEVGNFVDFAPEVPPLRDFLDQEGYDAELARIQKEREVGCCHRILCHGYFVTSYSCSFNIVMVGLLLRLWLCKFQRKRLRTWGLYTLLESVKMKPSPEDEDFRVPHPHVL